MHFAALTIFPELIAAFRDSGIMRRAVESGAVTLQAINIRDYALDRHHTTDDRPYGGGCGMVMKPEPLAAAIRAAKAKLPEAPVILLSPQGERFDQPMARQFAAHQAMILVCGRYEGVDERISEQWVEAELSIGDFVLTGGEVAAMAVMDAVTRLLPGVLGNADSAEQDSFGANRLDCAHYTRPPEFEGRPVPGVLQSGHHDRIRRWRLTDALMRTLVRRPDLLHQGALKNEEAALLRAWYGEIERIIQMPGGGGPDPSPGDGQER
ncbi:MAG: tRNA (guanosine(37)-N1)-methyltransferase TrmD [Desulfatitalea sp.]|nr:tRNA (guanosine(37)-N1)-methyltransferase TrmD [Desulfatitalea sp.]NNJ99546.1 tRNA (guanosine(37)-N1)-methyltransferase TrmD [Desulfatitalea sp.]